MGLFTFFIVVLSLMVFSVRMVSAEGTINIKDIYSPRWDVDKTLSPTTLREIYNRDTIKKVVDILTKRQFWCKKILIYLIFSLINQYSY